MTDIRLVYDGLQGIADFRLVGPALDTDYDLATAYIVSLFSDRLADPADVLAPNSTDRRGWWGDSFADVQGDLTGSRLWLLARTKSDARTPLRAQGYILESTQWAIDDGVVARNDARCFFLNGNQERLGAVLKAYRSDGSNPVALEFDWAWKELGAPV